MITVNRERVEKDFLGVKNENWMAASRDLGAHALRLYLYLAANSDGYRLALSPAAIQEAIGMPNSTYRDQFKILVNKGYLVETGGNSYAFYEVPKTRSACVNTKTATVASEEDATACAFSMTDAVEDSTATIREINNIQKTTDSLGINIEEDNSHKIIIPTRKVFITPPEAVGKKRPQPIEKPKRGEFIF